MLCVRFVCDIQCMGAYLYGFFIVWFRAKIGLLLWLCKLFFWLQWLRYLVFCFRIHCKSLLFLLIVATMSLFYTNNISFWLLYSSSDSWKTTMFEGFSFIFILFLSSCCLLWFLSVWFFINFTLIFIFRFILGNTNIVFNHCVLIANIGKQFDLICLSFVICFVIFYTFYTHSILLVV